MSIVTVSHLMPLLNPATDAELLRHFVDTRDETAFAEIVRRHGGLVRGVAQRLLVDTDMAHDVFQATFLLLAKKAKHGKWERTIGPWLYQVACRMAFKARARRAKQPIRFVTGVESSAPSFHPADSLVWAEVRNAIDDELSLLPAIYRDPLILCYLEGLSRDEAADALGCTLTVLKGRLERGRVALRRGLERRGLTLSVGLATLIPDSCVSAKASEELARLAADSVMGVPIPAALRQLILMGSSGTVLKAVTLGGVLAALLLGMAVAISESGHPPQTIDSNAKNLVHSKSEKATETEYEPLPVGAVARLGSTRFRHAGLRDFVILKDGKSVVTAGKDGVLRYWNLDTGQQIRTVSLMGYETVHRLATLSPDGKLFAAAEDWQLDIWDAGSGKQIKHFPGLEIRPSDFLCFSDNGDYLVIGDSRHNVSLLAWRSDRIDRQLPLPKTENGSDSSFHGYFTPDSSRVIAGGGWEEKLCVFDVKQLKKLLELPCNATTSTVTPDGKTLIVNTTRPGMRDSDICLHDLTTGKERKRFTVPGFFLRLTVSPDSRTLACSHSDQSCLVDLATGKVRHTLTGYPSGVDFTPDGTTLVSIEVAAAHLRTWNTVTGEEKNPLPGDIGLSAALVVSPDGRVLASADGMSKAVTLWDLSNGRVIRELPLGEIEKRRVRDLAYSTDGKLLYAVQGMGFTQWWDPTTGERRGSFQLSRPAKNALWQDPNAFFTSNYQLSPDGRRVVSLERRYDGLKVPRERTTLGMWDTSSGKLIAEREYPAPENNRRCKWLGNAFIGLPVPEGLSIFTPVTGKVQISIPDVTPNGPVVASPDGRLFAALVSARTDAVATVSVRIFEALTGRPISTIPVSKA
ncbi:MAG TPA: sigma-70 family RNA polymerase sigma factor, partial [Gemmata sp.]|nr:sigma-70 family RNA polymerase sigma factor [Gemmata sp.]